MSQNNNSSNNLIQRPIQPTVQVPFLAPIPTMSTEFYDSYLPGPQIRTIGTVAIGPRTNTPQHTNNPHNQRDLYDNPQDFIALVPEHLRAQVLAQVSFLSRTRITIEEVREFLMTINNSNSNLSSNTQCSICFSDVDPSDVFTTSCNHTFCLKCIATWVFTKVQQQMFDRATPVECSCPYCRGVFFFHRF